MLAPLHFSQLVNMARSPLHFKHALTTDEETLSFRLGRALHLLVLGSRPGENGTVVCYHGKRDERIGEWRDFKTANKGNEILTQREYDLVRGMSDAVLSHREAPSVLVGLKETPIRWSVDGRKCEGTPDVVCGNLHLSELKSCRTAEPTQFIRDATRYAYHAQLNWYRNGIAQASDFFPENVFIVAVEAKPPHAVTVFQLTQRALDQGERIWRLWFERLRACEESDQYPAYTQSIVPFDVLDDVEIEYGDFGEKEGEDS